MVIGRLGRVVDTNMTILIWTNEYGGDKPIKEILEYKLIDSIKYLRFKIVGGQEWLRPLKEIFYK